MRKPVRKRFVIRKKGRKTARRSPLVNAPETNQEFDGEETTVLGSSLSQDQGVLSSTNTATGASTSHSVVVTPGFHGYTNTLFPVKSSPATSPQTEASTSNAVTGALSEISAESPLCTPTSSTVYPAEVNVSESPSTQSCEGTSKNDLVLFAPQPPILPIHVLNEVKSKVEMSLHSGWMVILRQSAVHVVLLSKQSTLSIQRNLIFSTSGKVEIEVHCKSIDVSQYLVGVDSAFPLGQHNINEFVDRIIAIVKKIQVLEICAGYDDEKFKHAWASCQMGYLDTNPYQETRYVETFRSKSCLQLVPCSLWRCTECRKLYAPLKRRITLTSKEEATATTGNKYMTEEQKIRKLKEQQKAISTAKKKIKRLEERMQQLIKNESVVDKDLSKDLME